jgi:hypothetical protein
MTKGGVALEGQHVPIQAPASGEGLAGVSSLGEVKGDRLPVEGVGARCGVAVDVVSLSEGDAPVVEGEGEVAPGLVVDLGRVHQQRRLGQLLTGEAGSIDAVERGCLLFGRARCRAGRCAARAVRGCGGAGLAFHRQDPLEERPGLGVMLDPVVDRLDGPAKLGQLLVAGVQEPKAPLAEDAPLLVTEPLEEVELPRDHG